MDSVLQSIQNTRTQVLKDLADIKVKLFDLKTKEIQLKRLQKQLDKQLAELNETEKEQTK